MTYENIIKVERTNVKAHESGERLYVFYHRNDVTIKWETGLQESKVYFHHFLTSVSSAVNLSSEAAVTV